LRLLPPPTLLLLLLLLLQLLSLLWQLQGRDWIVGQGTPHQVRVEVDPGASC
jgi:hypothetical protein